MLRLTVEILPGGDAGRRRTIASMNIANVSDLADISDYDIAAIEAANPLTGTPSRSLTGTVSGHDRRQSVWSLISKAATAMQEAGLEEL